MRIINRLYLALGLLLALSAWTIPVQADVPMTGTFTAAQDCPAVVSIKKGTNPDNTKLAPQQSYQLIAGHNTRPTHYLLRVPGASPDRRWVEIGCGTINSADNSGASPGDSTTSTSTT